MKFRFAIEVETAYLTNLEQVERLLRNIITEGLIAYGHTAETLPISIEKMRQRTVDLDKPVGGEGK